MIRIALLLVLFLGMAFGQRPRNFFPWWDRPIARDLNLSAAQQRQIRSTVHDYRGKLIEAREAVEKAEAEFEEALNADPMDERRAETAAENLAKERANLTRAFSQMSLKLRMVLTPEQWKELQKRGPGQGRGPAAGRGLK